ncbi:hypothetical protein AWB71_04380 [Caballeronia peredens]|nr:hypothetical protein AWB71_04380 [Caballeronia peredens]
MTLVDVRSSALDVKRETWKITMKIKALSIVVTTLFISLAGTGAWAQPSGKASAARIDGQMVVQIVGRVKSVDVNADRVTIVNAQDREMYLTTGMQPQQIAALRPGSRVTDMMLQPVTLTPVRQAPIQEAIPGESMFIAQVADVDTKAGVVMLKDADGLPVEIHVRDPHKAAMLAGGLNVKVEVLGAPSSASVTKG